MKSEFLLGCALALAAVLGVSGAKAEEVAWQVPLYAAIPSVTGLGQQAVGRSADGEPRLYVSAWWSIPGQRHRQDVPSILAFDLVGGAPFWRRDLHKECSQDDRDVEALESFVSPLPGGDVAVAFQMAYSDLIFGRIHFACYARLNGSDGRVLWAHVDAPMESDSSTFQVFALATDRNGDIVTTGARGAIGTHDGRPRTLKLSGRTGESLWSIESEPVVWDPPRNALAVDAATGDVALLTAVPLALGVQHQAVWLNGRDGRPRWRRAVCEDLFYGFGGTLRVAETGEITFVLNCVSQTAAEMYITFGRLAEADGALVWRRNVQRNPIAGGEKYRIDDSGDVFLVGDLNLDGERLGAASFAAEDGRLRWSSAESLGGSIEGAAYRTFLNMAVGGGRLHLWETIGDTPDEWTHTTRLSSYDAASGHLLGQQDIRDAEHDALSLEEGSMIALPDGSATLAGISSSAVGNRWLWLASARPTPDSTWMRRELLAAPQPMRTELVASEASTPVLAASSAGSTGILVAGVVDGDTASWGVPSVLKIAQGDGRVLWRWQPQFGRPSSRGEIHGIAADATGSAYVFGRWQESPRIDLTPFAARIDTATGVSRWQRPIDAGSLAVNADGQPFVATARTLQRLSVDDGAALWSVSLPDDGSSDFSLVVDADGDPIICLPYSVTGEYGVQVMKFRAGDGVQVWQRRLPIGWPYLLTRGTQMQALPNGDVVVRSPATRLLGATGEIVWQRASLHSSRVLVGDAGQLIFGDAQEIPGEAEKAQLMRIDVDTGETLWSASPLAAATSLDSLPMMFSRDGDLLVAHATGSGYDLARLSIIDGTVSGRVSIQIPDFFLSGAPTGLIRSSAGRWFEYLFLIGDIWRLNQSHPIATIFRIDEPASPSHSRRPVPSPPRSPSR